MATRVLIAFFFACTVTGLPVERENNERSNNNIFTAMDYAILENTESYVYDDDKNLVQLTLEDYEEDEITTQNDLENRVLFFLFTRKNPDNPEQLYVDNESLMKKSNFDIKKPTRIVTHGWMNSRDSDACTLVRDAFLQDGDYNIIVIDWSAITIRPYIWAATRVQMVGQFVATMINFLETQGMDLSQTTMSGHSLGAHVVGLAARNAKGTVNYVVGLDPALPGFHLAGTGSRISSGDANYVEIIHTNAGLLGFLTAIGDSDFYPNGGAKQLGCLVDIGGACSHARSYRFFAESINSDKGFHGKKCPSFTKFILGLCKNAETSIMGGYKKVFMASGTYYLTTKASVPFAIGKS